MTDKNDDIDITLDNETTIGKISRYAKVSTAMGGLAAKLAGKKYLGVDINSSKHATQLTNTLGGLKGPILKIAQLLATIPQALPPEYVQELQSLQANAPAMGWPFVRRRMASELGQSWQSKFKSFDREASAAASLGQVHKAITLNGEPVACKLQYPDMETAVKTDLSQLQLAMNLFAKYDKAVSTKEIYSEIAQRLHEELDYIREAKHQKLYLYMLESEEKVCVPEVIDELSTARLLTSKWIDGCGIMSFKEAPQEQRDEIAMNLFRAWYTPLYKYGIVHGDPHPGNYKVADDLSINLLDFGCVRVFPSRFVSGVIRLYHALQQGDNDMAAESYKEWGFEDISVELIEILNTWAGFLYGPILEDKKRKIGEVGKTVYGKDIAEKVHAELRKIGGIKIPGEFVFMDRAALGMGSVFLHLNAQVNWFQVFNELIADFSEEKLSKTQSSALKKFNL